MPQLFGFDKVTIRGPRRFPVIGTFQSLYKLLDDPVELLLNLRDQGEVVALNDQNPAVVFVFGPERNREILTQPAMFRHDESFFKGPPGSGMDKMRFAIITINGDLHKRHRKLMSPAFHRSALDGYEEDIVAVTRSMLDRWKVNEVSMVDNLCREIALAVDMKCFYGLEIGDEAEELGHLAEEWVKYVTDPTTILLPFNIPGLGYQKAMKLGDEVVGRLLDLIERKRKMGNGQKDAMALLMNAHDDDVAPLTDDELVAEAATLFIAGHETVAMTLSWTLFLLERHPSIHAALMTELDAVLGGRDPKFEDIQKMVTLDKVIKESMRVLSVIPLLVMRACAEGATVGDYNMPKGSNIVVSPLATHHDPEIYPEPKRFLPDRWDNLKTTPYNYLPYSAGPRTCLGGTFADRALRLILPMILQRFRFSMPAGATIDRLIRANIMHARHHLPMHIEPASTPMHTPAPIAGDIHDLLEY
jgi:cytochrome P450